MHQPPLKTFLFSLGAGYQSGSKAFGLFVVSGLILLLLTPSLIFAAAVTEVFESSEVLPAGTVVSVSREAAGATDQHVIVIQGAPGQLANLQEWQDSDGNVLAAVTNAGDLRVVNAFVDGTLKVNGDFSVYGHIKSQNTSGVTTAAAGAGAGAGGNATIDGADVAGMVTINTGTGAAAGTLATVTFANTYGSDTVYVVLTPANGSGSTIQYLVGTTSAATFTIDANNLPADGTTYAYYYHVISKNADPF